MSNEREWFRRWKTCFSELPVVVSTARPPPPPPPPTVKTDHKRSKPSGCLVIPRSTIERLIRFKLRELALKHHTDPEQSTRLAVHVRELIQATLEAHVHETICKADRLRQEKKRKMITDVDIDHALA